MTRPGDLTPMLKPRSIVFVGASDRSTWSSTAYGNLKALGFTGKIHLVSRGGGMAHGQQTLTSCTMIGEPVDVALVMVPVDAVLDILGDIGAAGIGHAVILAGGFAELGGDGARLQDEVLATARRLGIALLGPNCLGFINFNAQVACWTGSMRTPPLAGAIGIVSQSGAVANFMAHFAHQHSVGLSCLVSTGNEPSVDLASVMNYLVDDPDTRVIALFAESVRDPAGFKVTARRALERGKPIVVLKIGRSEITAKAAQSHTGAVVGDDKVFDGVCQQLGLIRVDSIEEMIFTADLMAKVGPLQGSGVGVVSFSGGMCELAADAAHADGVSIPALASDTLGALRAVLPPIATPGNPLDVTGIAVAKPELFEQSLSVLAKDPGVSLLACIFDVPTGASGDWSPTYLAGVNSIGRYMKNSAIPSIMFSNTAKVVSDRSRELIAQAGVSYVPAGTRLGMRAICHAMAWSAKYRRVRPQARSRPAPAPPSPLPRSERQALEYLAGFGVPVIPSVLARSEQEALAAAALMEGSLALKIASPDIAHKSDVGGVLLNVLGTEALTQGFRQIMASAKAAMTHARLEGVLVSPMRREGVELFVGVRLDPQWGHVIAVGLGGVWIEALQDVSLRLLPVTPEDVTEMLVGLRGAKLLGGFRSAPPVDIPALALVVACIGDAALGLGPTLDTLEVNPLLAAAHRIEALDALASYKDCAP
ncbi:MAG: acetate--CoA ligase family protein [Sulfuricaulis sp.]|nr:acetate--CoA ligase family protein [Sulfuricaulis sp.]